MANFPISFHTFPLYLILYLLIFFQTHEATINNNTLTIQLLRRNSHSSSSSSFLPSFVNNPASSKVTSNNGDYLMKLSIGTPPVDLYGLADTGSDLIWAQCLPCDNCYPQKAPMFDPTMSETFKLIPCGSEPCSWIYHTSCSSENSCGYSYEYADKSVSKGVLAEERFSFGGVESQIVFGCGHEDTGTFNENDMGLIGLGGGPLSLVSQIGATLGGRRFSQCLVPFHTDPNLGGSLIFGEGSEVTGEGVVTTPLISQDGDTSYIVSLKGISVGDTFVSSELNIVIDSGTPTTYLPQDFYDQLVQELRGQSNMVPIEDDPDLGSQLCYQSDTNVEGPILTAHFDNSADVPLLPIQTFIPPRDGVFCLAMAPASDGLFIFGNFAQSNLLIGFDLDNKMVSFKPTDCTSQ
ncbi:hypothetical protein QN277_016398 [Acacia crassicarpa]|uniref:Peptidase A1 domain-containing protein n=1 Tax=Acacia crassicarpa TaxID=499986 RepID=A0AAE1TAH1_9FABA|nr:hypothetical protein QN277_016398 [Acacia crassicarpa]